MSDSNRSDIPQVWPWNQRFKGVLPLPGGYDGYLTWLEDVCQHIRDDRPRRDELHSWLEKRFSLTSSSAYHRVAFLLKVGLLDMDGGVCGVAEPTQRWLDNGDGTVLIAQIHSRTRFIGEMLHEVRVAQDAQNALHTWDLLAVANGLYGFGWINATQIDNRRGWLQSTKLIIVNSEKRFEITSTGRALLGRLELQLPPADASSESRPTTKTEAPGPPAAPADPDSDSSTPDAESDSTTGTTIETAETAAGRALADELRVAAVDSSDHTRLESAVRAAFEFLGFRAEQLGGSGKTDVLLDAPRGKNHSYRVTVDAKTVGASGASKGQLKDPQVDWPTLQEHRTKHSADYSLLVGPDPTGERIFSRAQEFDVTIISSDELAQLCLQHEDLPLGLGDYENLFTTSGRADTAQIDQRFEEAARLRDLGEAACRSLIEECGNAGPMSARDLWWALQKDHPENAWEIDEIQNVLRILSSDLVGAIETVPDADDGPETYVPATSLKVAQLRLRKLADALGSTEP
ncbi:MAG: hypothetical protein F4062_06900 [Acidimicrobiia bacterium]|nr:hypothetical protein [Acidimicrobiia bacterium]